MRRWCHLLMENVEKWKGINFEFGVLIKSL